MFDDDDDGDDCERREEREKRAFALARDLSCLKAWWLEVALTATLCLDRGLLFSSTACSTDNGCAWDVLSCVPFFFFCFCDKGPANDGR